MASITIRNVKDDTKQKLRIRAAQHGWSLEEELRRVLDREADKPFNKKNIAMAFYELGQSVGGVELVLPPRHEVRDPPDFS